MKFDADLLQKFIQGECTPEQIAFIRSYLDQLDKAELEELLFRDWQHPDTEIDKDAKSDIWKRLQPEHTEDPSAPVKPRLIRLPAMYAIAASIVLLVAVGLSRAFLFQDQAQVAPNIVINQSSQPLQITLDDQSEVWLTPGSKLVYPTHFAPKQRIVSLEGEGFFEVTSDSTHPFFVKTGDISTRVLGTSFDIRAFPNQDYVEIALLTGLVEIEHTQNGNSESIGTIKPGEKFRYNKSAGNYHQYTFVSQAEYNWLTGIIQFEGSGTQRVAETLENWYNVSIHIDSALAQNESLFFRIDTKKMTIAEVVEGINLVTTYTQYVAQNDSTFLVTSKK